MKKIACYISLALTIPTICSCVNKTQNASTAYETDSISIISNEDLPNFKDAEYYQEKGFQVFSEVNIAIKPPCILKDVSANSNGDFLLNYGGSENEENPDKFAAYQLVVSRLPVGYKALSEEKKKLIREDVLSKMENGMKKSQIVKVGNDGYDGIIVESTKNGYLLKGETFIKDEYVYGLVLITNDDLEKRFNQYTNSIRFVRDQNNSSNNDLVSISPKNEGKIQKLLDLNISFEAPCTLSASTVQEHDYYYSGAINGNDQENAIVYKIYGDNLPQPFSTMQQSDRNTIKSNLLNYAKTKGIYKSIKFNKNCYVAYSTISKEDGFNVNEAIVLTENKVYSFIVFSKRDINRKYDDFLRGIKFQ